MKVTPRVLDLLEKSLEGRDKDQLTAILNNMHKSYPEESIHLVKTLIYRSDYEELLSTLEFEVII